MKKKVIFIILALISISILSCLYLLYDQKTDVYKNRSSKENLDWEETSEELRLEGVIVDIEKSLSESTIIKLDVKNIMDSNNSENSNYIGKTLDLKCNLDLKAIKFKDDLKAGAVVVVDLRKYLKGQKKIFKVVDNSIFYRKNGIYYNSEGSKIFFPDDYQVVSRDYSIQGVVKELDKNLKFIVVKVEKNRPLPSTNPTEYDFKGKEITVQFIEKNGFYQNEIEDIRSKLEMGVRIIISFEYWSTPAGETVLGLKPDSVYYLKNNKSYDLNGNEIELPKF